MLNKLDQSSSQFVSVIIVNYNGREFIAECIDSILTSSYQPFEIILVDNASTDESLPYLKKKYGKNERVRIIRSEKQLYFTGGSNLGAKTAKGEKLFFLNSDTVINKNCLNELVKFTGKHKKHLVQPKILKYYQKNIIDNVGGKYSWGFGYGIGRGETDHGQYEQNRRLDFVNGTAFMIDKDFFWQLRGFDEEFRYFYEDVDLSLRVKKAGGECWYCYKSLIYHKGSLTFKKNFSLKKQLFYLRKNRVLTLWKNQKNLNLLFKLPGLIIIHFLLWIKEKFSPDNIIKSGAIVFAGTTTVNLLNFIFTLSMARLLGPQIFGELMAIFSLLIFTGIPSDIVTNIMARYSANYQAEKKFSLIKRLFSLATKVTFTTGVFFLLVFWLLIPFLSSFLHISYFPFFLFALAFPLMLLLAVAVGTLQGLQKFIPFSVTPIIATTFKLLLALFLVFLGFSTFGVIAAFIIGLSLAYLYARHHTRAAFAKNSSQISNNIRLATVAQKILSYAKTVSLTTLFLALFTNIDIILVKHYLTAQLAGQYAALSTIGRVILYGASPVLTVTFPLISAAHSTKKTKRREQIFQKSLVFVLIITVLSLFIFKFLPQLAVKILFGQDYLPISSLLFWYGLVIALHTASRTFISYFLATHLKDFLLPLMLILILQITLIILSHQTLFAIIISLLVANLMFLLACSVLYLKNSYGKE